MPPGEKSRVGAADVVVRRRKLRGCLPLGAGGPGSRVVRLTWDVVAVGVVEPCAAAPSRGWPRVPYRPVHKSFAVSRPDLPNAPSLLSNPNGLVVPRGNIATAGHRARARVRCAVTIHHYTGHEQDGLQVVTAATSCCRGSRRPVRGVSAQQSRPGFPGRVRCVAPLRTPSWTTRVRAGLLRPVH